MKGTMWISLNVTVAPEEYVFGMKYVYMSMTCIAFSHHAPHNRV